jgi:hypothetical protein
MARSSEAEEFLMARGWESKAVADQIEEGDSEREQGRQVAATAEERALKDRLHSLYLSKSRILQQLERAKHPSHRDVLMNGLKAIERQIDELSSSDTLTDAQP